jgi:hypothetical protein
LLSQKEIEYLRFPESFNVDYSYVLKHKIKSKVKTLNEELTLLSNAGFLNLKENSKSLTDFSKIQLNSNQAYFEELKCGRRDLNPGSLAWKAKVLNQTRRRPRVLSPYSQA